MIEGDEDEDSAAEEEVGFSGGRTGVKDCEGCSVSGEVDDVVEETRTTRKKRRTERGRREKRGDNMDLYMGHSRRSSTREREGKVFSIQ